MPENIKKAVIVGASSGIGRALTKVVASAGYAVGLCARRLELLEDLKREIPQETFIRRLDVRETETARDRLLGLIQEMGGCDLLILNAGVNPPNPEFLWGPEKDTVEINALGFAAMAHAGVEYFLAQGRGHLVGISSIASLRGSPRSSAYSASKAFVSNYLEGLRLKLRSRNIVVTDIRPGFVDTAMIAQRKSLFWIASEEKVAHQIFRAIEKKKKVAYVTKRWGMAAVLYKLIPDRLILWGYGQFRD